MLLGSALIKAEELFTPSASVKIAGFTTDVLKNKKTSPIKFSIGMLDQKNFVKSFNLTTNTSPVDFQPIGLGPPLTVENHVKLLKRGNNMFGRFQIMLDGIQVNYNFFK